MVGIVKAKMQRGDEHGVFGGHRRKGRRGVRTQSAGQRAADTKIVWVRWCQTERGLRIPGWGFKLGPMRKSEPE